MFKLIKYELKAIYKEIFMILCLIVILNALSCMNVGIAMMSLPFITIIALLGAFMLNVKSFKRDLYDDTGYLMFTLPQKGYSILGSKILTSLIIDALIFSVAIICNILVFIYFSIHFEQNVLDILDKFKFLAYNVSIYYILNTIFSYFYVLIVIYFCEILGKKIFKNSKIIASINIILFIGIITLLTYIENFISSFSKLNFNLDLFTQKGIYLFGTQSLQITINLANSILNMFIFIGLFLLISYMLEKKVEL